MAPTSHNKITTKSKYAWNTKEQDDGHGDKQTSTVLSTKPKLESVNLFKVLEDRYSYVGCHNFIFLVVWWFVVYQVVLSLTFYTDIAKQTNLIKNKLLVPTNEFERPDFNAWGIKLGRKIAEESLILCLLSKAKI